MAAKTPSSVKTLGKMQGLRLVLASFTDLDDGDTWASGLKGVVGQWANDSDDPTTQASVGVAVAHSAGTFTFYPAEDNKTADLFILVRS